jgi:hypothetical protein
MDPTPSPLQGQPQLSPLDQYMQNYGEQLQSMLANDPNQGQPVPEGDPGMAAAGGVSNLGPDLYQSRASFAPPAGAPPAQDAPPPQGAPPQGGQPPQSALEAPGAAQDPSAPKSALADKGGDADAGKGDGKSFRDLWQEQSTKQREQYLDKLQAHLKATDETIDSAYKTMMDQLGGRPKTDLSKQEKGMLLMEFGLRMMEHSRSVPGQTNSTGGAIGQAGVETMGSYKALQAQHVAGQQNYDKLQQQLTIAQGKEKAQLASRSALEEGRDVRNLGAQNASIVRTQLQQEGANSRNANTVAGAGARTDSRNSALLDRTKITEAGKNARQKYGMTAVSKVTQTDTGALIGVDKQGNVVPLNVNGAPVKGGTGPGGHQTAAQANYSLYMDTYGKGEDGQPLEGEDLQKAKEDALTYAANPKSYQLTDAQMQQMATKSADSFLRANPTSFLGMSPDELQKKRTEVVEQEYQRLKRGGSATGAGVQSALNKGAPRTRSALTPSVPGTPAAQPKIATQPPPGGKAPNAKQLELLRTDPTTAPLFLKHFGYLPSQYHKYLQNPNTPRSALQ